MACSPGAARPEAGAVVLFLGTTREMTAGRRTVSLDYECYPEMAEKKLAELEAEARRRWPLVECIIVHRLGQCRSRRRAWRSSSARRTGPTPSKPASG